MFTIENNNVHYNAIRNALTNGNAAVMVGAGFSRNAENGEQLATWVDIAEELWRQLNPSEGELQGFSAGVVSQLGEQYARVFSKPALEELLKRLIPDDRVRPGVLHGRLLALPWTEIFTTNYDSLLERAADSIVERAHYTVSCRQDIPQSKILNRRRIVKLHGSFPSQRPFIFTEEEYRRYTKDFAPFVNMVRQSLLQNVFCLIGFSGDDPNFLHWIGWVRDMLDQHALPVYLFLDRAPSLGQQKLLEARCVTPVVLPLPTGVEEQDYAARIEALFRLIDPRLVPGHEQWGTLALVEIEGTQRVIEDAEASRARVTEAFTALAKLRETYPGWLIAPLAVRSRLRMSIRVAKGLNDDTAMRALIDVSEYLCVVILAEYAWYHEVLLQSLDDKLANAAFEAIKATVVIDSAALGQHGKLLNQFDAGTPIRFRKRWRELVLSVLRWMRQGLQHGDFDSLALIAVSTLPNDQQLIDEIAHERVLLALYEGERDVALQLLNDWEMRASDGYMLVRKGLLLSEVGQVERGFSVSLSGLQQIRRDQRSKSDSARYFSEEAWACLALTRQVHSSALSRKPPQNEDDDEKSLENLGRRLSELAEKGFDVRREVEQLGAALEAEALVPSDPVSVIPSFDLGVYSTSKTLNTPSVFVDKIVAAFAWLTLTDRTALVPRIGSMTFEMDSFARAAWWTQYADSMQRVLSVVVRTMNTKILEPRKPSEPLHAGGWLSRFQVGKTNEALALAICDRSLGFIERMFGGGPQESLEHPLRFHIEIFGRLVIRLSDLDQVESFFRKIIDLHKSPFLSAYPRLWRQFGVALLRCFEALPAERQQRLLSDIWSVAKLIPTEAYPHFARDWVPLHAFIRETRSAIASNGERAHVTDIDPLLVLLESANREVGASTASSYPELIWQYLYLLDAWSLIDEGHREAIRRILWTSGADWPTIAGFHPWAAYAWGQPAGIDMHLVFRKWILARPLASFTQNGSMIVTSKGSERAWGFPVDHEFLRAILNSFENHSWPNDDLLSVLTSIKRWWDDNWYQIRTDLDAVDELRAEARRRLSLIDQILAKIALDEVNEAVLHDESVELWLVAMLEDGPSCGAQFWRFRYVRATALRDESALRGLQCEVLEQLLDADLSTASSEAPRVISAWISDWKDNEARPPRLLVEAVAGMMASRRMPVLPWTLSLTLQIVKNRQHWVDDEAFALIDLGLRKMHAELAYHDRKLSSGIPDDNVPSLRFGCGRLARVISRQWPDRTSEGVQLWLDSAVSDPLPEMRFLEERAQ